MCQNLPAASRICSSSSSSSSFWSTACWDYRVLNSARLRLKSGVDTMLILQVKYDGVLSSLFHDSNRFHILRTMQRRGIREHTSKEDEANQNRANDTEPALSQKQGQNLFIADEFTFTSHLSLLMQFRLCTLKGTVIGLGHSGLKINSINM